MVYASWDERDCLIYFALHKKTITSGEHSLCFCNSDLTVMCSHNIYQRSTWWEVCQLISTIYCPERKHSQTMRT